MTDHGTDGKDARTHLVARFTSHAKALDYLKARGHTQLQHSSYWHKDPAHRHTMGAISYELRPEVPIDIDPV